MNSISSPMNRISNPMNRISNPRNRISNAQVARCSNGDGPKHLLMYISYVESSTSGTPLAPSVEKAYYRKCIALKRRLNEVEAANDEAKIRRVRLDRSIMKMRLERAFLLEQLSKRMEHNVDGSEGSADEGLATVSAPVSLSSVGHIRAKTEQQQPPPDRPHRDRRRTQGMPSGGLDSVQPSHLPQQSPYGPQQPAQFDRRASDMAAAAPMVTGPGGYPVRANAMVADGQYIYVPHSEHPTLRQSQSGQAPGYPMPPAPLPHGSPYGAPVGVPGAATHMNGMHGMDGADDRHDHPNINRSESGAGEVVSGGPAMRQNGTSDRRILPSSSDPVAGTHMDRPGAAGGSGGFTAVNHQG
ncbi:hypothetical protein LTR08_002469 [Meristemomyces frigidus]|nr:hypothetical protein LTR08_002469 [Meristemomyces frigidus]